MASKFLFLYSQLNLFSFSPEKNDKIKEEIKLVEIKVEEIFEYEKNNDGYQDRAKSHNQIVNKALPITQILYSGYSLLFLFDNTIGYSVYSKDIFQVKDISKDSRGKQPILQNDQFDYKNICFSQLMYTVDI